MAGNRSPSAETTTSKKGISRREFARRAALATASATALPGVLLGHAPSPSALPHDASAQAPSAAFPPTASQAEVELKFLNILRKYGSRLSDEQKADVQRLLGETQKQLEKLRAFPLDNSDQPATVLKPLIERARPATRSGAPSAPDKHKGKAKS